jgi:hypothetical protein
MSRLLKAQATNDLLQEIIKNRQLKVDEEKQWRAREVAFRGLEQRWWAVDKKRLYTDQLVERMSVFSELAAFAAGFQMVMLYELQLLPPAEHRYSHALLAIWGIGIIVVTCTNVCILFMAMIIAIDVLSDSGREPPWSFPRSCRTHEELEKLPPTGCFEDGAAEGVFRTAEQYHERWRQRHERRVMRMLTAFNYSAPFFMFNLGVSTLVKFYMAPSAAWTGFACALCGMLAWWHFQRRKVQYLQAQSASDTSNHGRERGMSQPGGAHAYPPDSASGRQSLARVPDAPRNDNSTSSEQALGHEEREALPEVHTRASGQPPGHWHLEPRAAFLRRESTLLVSYLYQNSAPAVGDLLHVHAHRAGLPCRGEHGGDGEAYCVAAEPRSDGRGGGGEFSSSIQRRRIEMFDSELAAQTCTAGETLFPPDQRSLAFSPSSAPEDSGGGGARGEGGKGGEGGEGGEGGGGSDAAGNERGAAGGAEDSRGGGREVRTYPSGLPLVSASTSSPTGAPPLSTLMETEETLAVGHRPLRWGGAAGARAQCRSKQPADDVILHDTLGLGGQNGGGEEETEFYPGYDGEKDAAAR